MKDYSKLDDNALRVEVSKALGWTELENWSMLGLVGINPANRCPGQRVPDFPRDLNACHEFEKALENQDSCWKYEEQLAKQVDETGIDAKTPAASFFLWHATARQRCIALLMTLKPE